MCTNLAISGAGYSLYKRRCPLHRLQAAQQMVSTEAAAQGTGRPTLQTGSLMVGAVLRLQALPVD